MKALLLFASLVLVSLTYAAPRDNRQRTTVSTIQVNPTNAPAHEKVQTRTEKNNQKTITDPGKFGAIGTHLINVPTICGPGEKVDINGDCRAVWGRKKRSIPAMTDDTIRPVPVCIIACDIPDRDCPPGQKPDANGNCRDVWDG